MINPNALEEPSLIAYLTEIPGRVYYHVWICFGNIIHPASLGAARDMMPKVFHILFSAYASLVKLLMIVGLDVNVLQAARCSIFGGGNFFICKKRKL